MCEQTLLYIEQSELFPKSTVVFGGVSGWFSCGAVGVEWGGEREGEREDGNEGRRKKSGVL